MPYYRSRAIWDETRKDNASVTSYIRAILYELQPIRFSTININQIVTTIKVTCIQLLKVLRLLLLSLYNDCIKKLSMSDLKYFSIIGLYVFVVLYIHRLFDAGLIVIITTILILIFTIGLSDNNNRNGTSTSAYSVFNRGFQQLLGNIDADAFVNQYVGGGLAAAAAANGNGGAQEQQQNHDHGMDDMNNEDDVIVENDNGVQQQQNNGTSSRKSGKKARRRNIEQRREMQRQRQMAREYGHMAGAGDEDEHIRMLQAAAWEE